MPDNYRIFNFSYLITSVLQRYRRLLINILPGKYAYRRFIILSSPRSGSTLLHTYLNSSLNIYSLGERPWRDLENGIVTDYFKSYPNIIRAVGFKVFYQFSEQAPYHTLYQKLKEDKDLQVIHLIRENILEQYISEKLAWQKRAWTRNKQAAISPKIQLDLLEFEAFKNQQQAQRSRCLRDFKDHPMTLVTYKSLVHEPTAVLKEIQSFLGVPPRRLFTVMKKQASYSLFDLLENVEEVKEKYPEFFT